MTAAIPDTVTVSPELRAAIRRWLEAVADYERRPLQYGGPGVLEIHLLPIATALLRAMRLPDTPRES